MKDILKVRVTPLNEVCSNCLEAKRIHKTRTENFLYCLCGSCGQEWRLLKN